LFRVCLVFQGILNINSYVYLLISWHFDMHYGKLAMINIQYCIYIAWHLNKKNSKNAGLFQSKFGSNMEKPKCWVKKVIKKNYS